MESVRGIGTWNRYVELLVEQEFWFEANDDYQFPPILLDQNLELLTKEKIIWFLLSSSAHLFRSDDQQHDRPA